MPITALIFDLDDTLVMQEGTESQVILALAQAVAGRHRLKASPQKLAQSVFNLAEQQYRAAPVFGYGDAMGISAVECLWGRFAGEDANLKALAAWAPTFRVAVWRQALAGAGVQDKALAEELAGRFIEERSRRHIVFPEVPEALTALQARCALALLTNGAPDMQREKLEGAGLAPFFPVVAISGELGIGKPDPRIFGWVLAQLGAVPAQAVMVGDSLPRDIAGAQGAGIKAVWINRSARAFWRKPRITPDAEIDKLTRLSDVLKRWA